MRIASLQPSITITLQGLGRLDALCACTKYCVDAVPALAARGIPVLADSWSANTEAIVAARPDLVIASVPYRMESLAAILKTGTPVLALAPHTLTDIYHDTRLIAAIVRAAEQGETLVRQMQSAVEKAKQQTDALEYKPLVYCEEWGKPLIHSQRWVAELVEAAGGRFLGQPGATTSIEAVAAADPDVLIFSWCGAGDRVPLGRVTSQRGWLQLRAVREGRVYCVPDEYLNTPANTILEGLACIASALHPDLFPRHARLVSIA